MAASHGWSYDTLAEEYLTTFDREELKGLHLTGNYYGESERTTPTLTFEYIGGEGSYILRKKLRTSGGGFTQVINWDGSKSISYNDYHPRSSVEIYPHETDGRFPLAADDLLGHLGYCSTKSLSAKAAIQQPSDTQLQLIVTNGARTVTTVIDFDVAGEVSLPMKEDLYVGDVLHQSYEYSNWRMVTADNGGIFPIPGTSVHTFYDFQTGELFAKSRLELVDVEVFQSPLDLDLPQIPSGAPVTDYRTDPPEHYTWAVERRELGLAVKDIAVGLDLVAEAMGEDGNSEPKAEASPAPAPIPAPAATSEAEPVVQNETDKPGTMLRIALVLSAIVSGLLLVLIGLFLKRTRVGR